ncbi:PASTA domain-containing protein [Cryobacterium levicorallinum]|uniref:Membrane carboxypeptidase (Penicillin-binding protein) n=1 Tax=Cryobacterium levicorallinum TaxID=995038 RepID=A0A1I3AWS3_9MICO|nr:transglycosylase domain-containing protein [Cryobacterium levicorallinum]TFB87941.1 PASTA domain-containing protein [Cryobacterium levicorallinum]SFH54216.1 Membrane carboxypeptidase (penicillin-binding protein) [Cryobacterium levicorallinum]
MSAKNRTVSGALGGLLGLVGMSAVAGILVTAAVAPAVALSGMAATNTINVFDSLPEYLSIDRLSQKSNIYASTDAADPVGSRVLLASFYEQNRVDVASDAISQFAKDAAIAGEDPRFMEHGGVDIQSSFNGAVQTFAGGETRGGSSITQQYVKNVLIQKCEVMPDADEADACYSDATKPTADRKLREMRLAIGIEKKYEKEDILRGYLNIAGYGGSVYGIEAAANYYFNTTAALLTLPQAASLVAIVNNPVKFQLDRPDSETNGAANGYADNKFRRDYILGEMLKYDKIAQADYDAAVAAPVEPVITVPSTGCQTAGGSAYFCDYVTKILKSDPTFGADAETRLENFKRGGFDVYTTLDLELQVTAENSLNKYVPKSYPGWDVGGVVSSVRVGTGEVLAMAQNKDYSQAEQPAGSNFTSINYNTDYATGGSGGFQPGSTYKVFTLAEWLKEGHALTERVDSRVKSDWGTFQDSCLGPQSYGTKFSPRNDGGEGGPNESALHSTTRSINTGFIGMAKELDLCGIKNTAEAFDVHAADGGLLGQNASSVIGTNYVAPLTMAVAFAGIANNGMTCTPIVISKMVSSDGTELPIPQTKCTQSVEPAVAAGMQYAMATTTIGGGTAAASGSRTSPRVPIIGKTGTTDSAKDTWMSGASSKVATVVGVVNVSGDYKNQRFTTLNGLSAQYIRHYVWPEVMSVANARYGGDAFPEASSSVINAVSVPVPDVRGKSMSDAKSAIEASGFLFVDGGVTSSEMPAGTVANTDPAGGSSSSRGSSITAYSSDGTGVTIPSVIGKSEADARSTLTAAPYGFTVAKLEQATTDKAQDGKVVAVQPGEGTASRPGDAVTIVIGKYTAPKADASTDKKNE